LGSSPFRQDVQRGKISDCLGFRDGAEWWRVIVTG
jgi:hypothetical protein